MSFVVVDEEDYTSRPIEQVKNNETPSGNPQLLTITLPEDQSSETIKTLPDVTVINEIS